MKTRTQERHAASAGVAARLSSMSAPALRTWSIFHEHFSDTGLAVNPSTMPGSRSCRIGHIQAGHLLHSKGSPVSFGNALEGERGASMRAAGSDATEKV